MQFWGFQNHSPLPACAVFADGPARGRRHRRPSRGRAPRLAARGWHESSPDVRCAWAGRPHYIDVTLRHLCAIKWRWATGRQRVLPRRPSGTATQSLPLQDSSDPVCPENVWAPRPGGARLAPAGPAERGGAVAPLPAMQKWLSQLSCPPVVPA